MSLESDTVYRNATCSKSQHQLQNRVCLWTDRFRAVVVEIEFRCRIGAMRPNRGGVNVIGSDRPQPDGVPKRAAIVSHHLIDYVPSRNIAAVATDHRRNVDRKSTRPN